MKSLVVLASLAAISCDDTKAKSESESRSEAESESESRSEAEPGQARGRGMAEPDSLGVEASAPPDAATSGDRRPRIGDAGLAQLDAAPPPPPGITEAHLAELDRMMGTLNKLREEVTAADDCEVAARAVIRHWKGFKPIKQVLREVNPERDPAIEKWLRERYLRPALGAVGTLANKGMNECKEDPVWKRAVRATDFMGAKRRRR